jgi:hypothetical protein
MKLHSRHLLTAACLMLSASAHATTITWLLNQIDPISGQPVDATATFMIQPGTLTLTLSDLRPDPVTDAQNINGIMFALDNTSGPITFAGGVGDLIDVDGAGAYTDLGMTALSDWAAGFVGNTIDLSMIGTPHAEQTIIGAPDPTGHYSSANGSITGSVHNPFILQSGIFTFTGSGIGANTTIEAPVLSFGTSAGDSLTMTPSVPEPGTWLLSGTGLFAVFLPMASIRRRKAAELSRQV